VKKGGVREYRRVGGCRKTKSCSTCPFLDGYKKLRTQEFEQPKKKKKKPKKKWGSRKKMLSRANMQKKNDGESHQDPVKQKGWVSVRRKPRGALPATSNHGGKKKKKGKGFDQKGGGGTGWLTSTKNERGTGH